MNFFQLVKEPSISLGVLGWFSFLQKEKYQKHAAVDTGTCINLTRFLRDPTLWGMNLAVSAPDGSFPIAGIVRPCSPNAVASSFAQHVGLGLSVVLFQRALYCFRPIVGAAEGIVLPSWGYCPTLMCLFMLLVSLSGQPQFYATRPPCSHSHSPPTPGLLL